MTGIELSPVIFSDQELSTEHLTLDFIKLLRNLEPFGREFENPIFHTVAKISNLRPIGDGSHYKLSFKIGNKYFKAVWFNAILLNDENAT